MSKHHNMKAKKRGIPSPVFVNEQWVCSKNCLQQTHRGLLFRRPITNGDVYQGCCIKCHPSLVPQDVAQAHQLKDAVFASPSIGFSAKVL